MIRTNQVSSLRLFALCAAAVLSSPLCAEVFDGGAATTDYNTAANWENDTLPGTAGGEFAIIGQAGATFQNPAIVDLNAAPVAPNNPGDLRVGNGANGDGMFNHTAGDLVTNDGNWSFIAADGTGAEPSRGAYNLSNSATFSQSNAEFHIGVGGGARDIAGGDQRNEGLLTVADDAVFNADAFYVGSNDSNSGQVDQSGGEVNVNRWISVGREGGALGAYNMSGGSLAVEVDGITVGESSGASGTFNFSGASTINTPRLRVGRNASSTGAMTIIGGAGSINTGSLSVGADDAAATDSTGTLTFIADGGVTPITASGDVILNDGSAAGSASLIVDLTTNPVAGDVLLVDITGGLTGQFVGLPEGAVVPGSGGRTITYAFGGGNSIALLVPEPTAGLLAAMASAMGAATLRRRRA